MANKQTLIGDVFSVKTDNGKKFFQLIAIDSTQLNSDVIRCFKKEYSTVATPNLSDVVKDEVEFYVHCVTKLGLKMGLWETVGNVNEIGDITNILFRGSKDSGSRPGEQIKISNNWYVWKVNSTHENVGSLKGENKKAEIGIVVNPNDVIERIKTGKYSFFYPAYE